MGPVGVGFFFGVWVDGADLVERHAPVDLAPAVDVGGSGLRRTGGYRGGGDQEEEGEGSHDRVVRGQRGSSQMLAMIRNGYLVLGVW